MIGNIAPYKMDKVSDFTELILLFSFNGKLRLLLLAHQSNHEGVPGTQEVFGAKT